MVQELIYDPWGRLRNPFNQELYAVGAEPTPFLGRGYTGHEHLTMFGLINMNARLYDPAVGRFLSPDPYVQSPDFSQNFNRYSYCLNNPLKFTDQNGEFIHLIIGAIVGGVVNWAANGCKFSWEGLSYFGAGAVAGVATALSPGSFIAISAGLSGANSIIGQGFNNGWKNIDFGQVAGSAIMGGVTSYAGGLMGSAMHLDKLLNGISSPLLQKGLEGVIGGAVIGSTFGGMSAVANGHNFFDGAWSGAKMGVVTGAISGFGSAVQYSTKNHVNLLTGKLKPVYHYTNSDYAPAIEATGIRQSADGFTYTTTDPNYSSPQAIDALNLNRAGGPRDALFKIDASKMATDGLFPAFGPKPVWGGSGIEILYRGDIPRNYIFRIK